MRVFATTLTLVSLFASALSALSVVKYPGAPPDRYIVKVKDGVDKNTLITQIVNAHGQIIYNWDIINGFAAYLDTVVLNLVLQSLDVEFITEDGVATISGTQTNAPWGLSRISHPQPLPSGSDPKSLTYTYDFPSDSLGDGVDIYTVDTGIYTDHSTFQGRAVWGATFGGYANQDGNGHGTHVSGTAAGFEYGVAKKAKLIAVKVLSDAGSGSYSDVISGLNYVKTQAAATKKQSVVNMSLGGTFSLSINLAVRSLTKSGVHVAVAAGNSNEDAALFSPASEPSACTVGASDINDARASFSNYGMLVDIFAPGANVTSAWIGSNTNTKTISGTSMATPHITGLIAYLLSAEGPSTPKDMIKKLQSYAVQGALSNIPPLTCNLLAQNHNLA